MLAQVPGQGGVAFPANTPPAGGTGATPILGPDGCPQYACTSTGGQSPTQIGNASCQAQNPVPPGIIIGVLGGSVALFLLPGILKILALPIAAYGVLTSFTSISQVQPNGTCQWVSQGL